MAKLEVVRQFPTKSAVNEVKRGRVGNIRRFSKEQYADALKNGAVYVGRPSKWGNQFRLENEEARYDAIVKYSRWAFSKSQTAWRNEVRAELTGRDLICWCSPAWCHADILAGIASTPTEEVI